MNKQTKYIVGGLVLAVVLMVGGQMLTGGSSSGSTWEDTDVACLPFGHQNLAFHVHPQLSITVDGESERIPGNTGINAGCMAEVHMHDASGKLHVESTDANKQGDYELQDFFAVWGKDLQRDGYTLTASVNGSEVANPSTIKLEDGDRIRLSYESATSSTETSGASSAATSTE